MKKFLNSFERWFARFSALYIIIIILCCVRVDYYIYMPGNLTDVSSEITVDNIDKDLNGEVSSVYVLSFTRPTLFKYLVAKNLKYAQVVKMTEQDIKNYDSKLDLAIGRFDSKQSFSSAELAAYSLIYEESGTDYYKQVTYIYSAYKWIDSNTNYLDLVGKMITGYGDKENINPTRMEVSTYLSSVDKDDYATIYVSGDSGKTSNKVEIKRTLYNDNLIYGLSIQTSYELNIDSYVKVSNVYTQGPSGGAMQALYIYLMLSDTDYLKGRHIAGTGTIGYILDSEGNIDSFGYIGAIGCVEQKLYAAYLDGAKIFYCPSSNYKDCMKAYETYKFNEDMIRVVEVKYLNDIIEDLKK